MLSRKCTGEDNFPDGKLLETGAWRKLPLHTLEPQSLHCTDVARMRILAYSQARKFSRFGRHATIVSNALWGDTFVASLSPKRPVNSQTGRLLHSYQCIAIVPRKGIFLLTITVTIDRPENTCPKAGTIGTYARPQTCNRSAAAESKQTCMHASKGHAYVLRRSQQQAQCLQTAKN